MASSTTSVITHQRRVNLAKITRGEVETIPKITHIAFGSGGVDESGQPVLDGQGNPKTQSVTGVYCLWGDTARLKPVKVLWQEEEYILAAPDEEALAAFTTEQARESRRLRAGDQVITAAAELYDGKVIR